MSPMPVVAAKFAVRAMTKVLRLELLGRPIRVTEIHPGLVKTRIQRRAVSR